MKSSDYSTQALSLFRRIIAELGEDPTKAVPSFEVFDKVKVDKPALEELAKKKILGASTEKDGRKEFFSITLTKKGLELKELVEGEDLLGESTPPTIIDATKETVTAGALAKGHRKSNGTVGDKLLADVFPEADLGKVIPHGKHALKDGEKAVVTQVPIKPAPTTRVKAAPVDRAALRSEAIKHCMSAVKADSWRKADYKPMMAHLQATWPALFAKLKTPDKVKAYATGILDFCLAACRKMDTGRPAAV